jgi:hypothetical protein
MASERHPTEEMQRSRDLSITIAAPILAAIIMR